ncbi:hypothetical protein LAZ67_2003365 [Cordylochernes scorpioides]|uniref:Uncharacterized protein n=1 Tax=Cordylochernes scorpioides TaxID=51811 RepID=A0ABY6K7E5_9ARAC|nr:hypothetical protein LAZ67_2003365 [Cordylochernes scorpioides]
MKNYYDKSHGAKDLDELEIGDLVWIVDLRTWGKVMKKAPTPRSYFIETPRGVFQRNRFHIRKGYPRTYPLTAEEIRRNLYLWRNLSPKNYRTVADIGRQPCDGCPASPNGGVPTNQGARAKDLASWLAHPEEKTFAQVCIPGGEERYRLRTAASDIDLFK